jgi:Calcineurin-like phosphoesterase
MTNRRDFLQLAALGGSAIFVSGVARGASPARASPHEDFYFVQLSDTHWGYEGAANPDARGTLPRVIAAINALPRPPDFIMFTGDLTHTTNDPLERRRRLAEFRDLTTSLRGRTCDSSPASMTPRRTAAAPIGSTSATRTTPSTTKAFTSSHWTTCR